MSKSEHSDEESIVLVYGGLAGLELADGEHYFGDEITLTKTYAHLMAPFLMAFSPAPPGGYHPAPWKAATGGFGFDITAELRISGQSQESTTKVLRLLVALLRLWCNPAITIPVTSNVSFSTASEAQNDAVELIPFEVGHRYFRLMSPEGAVLTSDQLEWVKAHWQSAYDLIEKNEKFLRAFYALDQGQFNRIPSLTLVSLWGALESLFSPSSAELRFRVSGLLAAFLEDPGEARQSLQKKAAKLYDARSNAAHGGALGDSGPLLETFELLRQAMIKMISDGHVPTMEELESRLFGAT